MNTGLIVETGPAWPTHHFAGLIGYGSDLMSLYAIHTDLYSYGLTGYG